MNDHSKLMIFENKHDSSVSYNNHKFQFGFTKKEIFRCAFCNGANCKRCSPLAYLSLKQPAIPYLHSTWITNTVLAMQRPSDTIFEKGNVLESFHLANITAIFNTTEPGEHPFCGTGILEHSGFPYSPEKLMHLGIKHFNYNWPDMTIPSIQQMLNITQIACMELSKGGKIAVHCHAGYGRTGITIACILIVKEQFNASNVIQLIRKRRPGSIQTIDQEHFVTDFEKHYHHMMEIFPIHDHYHDRNLTLNHLKSIELSVKQQQYTLLLTDRYTDRFKYIHKLVYHITRTLKMFRMKDIYKYSLAMTSLGKVFEKEKINLIDRDTSSSSTTSLTNWMIILNKDKSQQFDEHLYANIKLVLNSNKWTELTKLCDIICSIDDSDVYHTTDNANDNSNNKNHFIKDELDKNYIDIIHDIKDNRGSINNNQSNHTVYSHNNNYHHSINDNNNHLNDNNNYHYNDSSSNHNSSNNHNSSCNISSNNNIATTTICSISNNNNIATATTTISSNNHNMSNNNHIATATISSNNPTNFADIRQLPHFITPSKTNEQIEHTEMIGSVSAPVFPTISNIRSSINSLITNHSLFHHRPIEDNHNKYKQQLEIEINLSFNNKHSNHISDYLNNNNNNNNISHTTTASSITNRSSLITEQLHHITIKEYDNSKDNIAMMLSRLLIEWLETRSDYLFSKDFIDKLMLIWIKYAPKDDFIVQYELLSKGIQGTKQDNGDDILNLNRSYIENNELLKVEVFNLIKHHLNRYQIVLLDYILDIYRSDTATTTNSNNKSSNISSSIVNNNVFIPDVDNSFSTISNNKDSNLSIDKNKININNKSNSIDPNNQSLNTMVNMFSLLRLIIACSYLRDDSQYLIKNKILSLELMKIIISIQSKEDLISINSIIINRHNIYTYIDEIYGNEKHIIYELYALLNLMEILTTTCKRIYEESFEDTIRWKNVNLDTTF